MFALAQEAAGHSGQYGTAAGSEGLVPAAVGVLTVAVRSGRTARRTAGHPFVLP